MKWGIYLNPYVMSDKFDIYIGMRNKIDYININNRFNKIVKIERLEKDLGLDISMSLNYKTVFKYSYNNGISNITRDVSAINTTKDIFFKSLIIDVGEGDEAMKQNEEAYSGSMTHGWSKIGNGVDDIIFKYTNVGKCELNIGENIYQIGTQKINLSDKILA